MGIDLFLLGLTVQLWIALAIRDALRFEIEPAIAGAIALTWLATLLATDGSVTEAALGALVGLVVAGIFYWRRYMGQGDVTLFALVGWVAGCYHLFEAAMLFTFFGVLTGFAYGYLRGKRRWWRSAYPAAIPASGAALTLLVSGGVA